MGYLFDALFGGSDEYGVDAPSSRRATGGYYPCPRCKHPCLTQEEARNHCSPYTVASTRKCPTCNGEPKRYSELMGHECWECHGRGTVPL